MRKTYFFLVMLFAGILPAFAQFDLEEASENLWDEIKGSAIYIFAAVFVVSALVNSEKLTGGNRDYAAFFRGVLLWVGAIVVMGGVVTFILSQSF